MKLFEGKTKTERNKTIAALALGGACLIVLFFAFGRGMFSGSSTASAKPTPTPKKTTSGKSNPGKLEMPSADDQMLDMTTQPISYNPSSLGGNDPGRNIFAFFEPGKPTPYVPPPPPVVTPIPTTPAPTPDIQIAVVNPQSVYAGSNGFRMEISGDKFTPDTKIYFDQQELPATFVSETRMTADIPNVLIKADGKRTIMAQTTDGTKRSNPVIFEVEQAPKPQFQYIGMIARTRNNNNTAYFQESGKPLPTAARLNDIVGGRFRVLSISAQETVLEDTSLGFKHKLPLFSPPATASTGPSVGPGVQPGGTRGFPGRDVYSPVNPNPGMNQPAVNSRIPGIPDGIPRYIPPASNSNTRSMPSNTKQRDNDEDDDGIDK